MDSAFLRFHDVSFTYDSSSPALFRGLEIDFTEGWTGILGANGTGKTTLLLLASGLFKPSIGQIRIPGSVLYCPQKTDEVPALLPELIESPDGRAGELRGRLEIGDEWAARWDTLSHGERKKAQIAVALWSDPLVLLVDEPTNHVDARTRDELCAGLERFRGIGLLVSHDRELLDRLCQRCLIIDPPRVVLRSGGYTETIALDQEENARARERYEQARAQERLLKKRTAAKRQETSRTHARLSKRNIDPKDHDTSRRIDLARFSAKDRTSARQTRELQGRLERASAEAASFDLKKTYNLSLWFQSERARRDVLFSLEATRLQLGGDKVLAIPDLVMRPRDRIGLSGPNGCGKSTFVRYLVGALALPQDRLIYLPQEVSAEDSARITENLGSLPDSELGRAMTVVKLLGSDPDRILASASLSPGEVRKVFLAIGISRVPHLIVMDEPTNHLDVPSIECLTSALAACECGLLLVSHDIRFLERLSETRWEITEKHDGLTEMRVQLGKMS
jgi:ATPase subunit of ABC transporter with duplicated ATPase domains